ncbi:MAG TPA: EAL domain-containing response regulator [Polyangiaceae bacterium]|jgi:EAL domain-containing protein (putative c-di-GMP-specific phosphodiesterase class I)|nr:EAL domain-containing response regulator [Polyangiaceae bacterium]
MSDQMPRLLLVDDDEAILRAYKNSLSSRGLAVETAANGKLALAQVDSAPFDVIVSDVSMPEMGGLEFLRAVRRRDLDVPVILTTGEPGLDSAVQAIEYGAFRYLFKPVELKTLEENIQRAVRLHRLARLKRQALELAGATSKALGDRAGLEARFTSALERLWMAYQPIVHWKERRVFGYEALLRSAEPSLPSPPEILDAAERLGRLHDLGRAIRHRVAAEARQAPSGIMFFVNLHAADLNDEEMFRGDTGLGKLADRVILEITERASLDIVKNVESRIKTLRELGYAIAVDDLGSGYAGLTSFTLLEPAMAKLDMSLIRGIDAHSGKQAIVRSMCRLCEELGIMVVAEGVENEVERDALVALGCNLLQGYFFGRPQRGLATPAF